MIENAAKPDAFDTLPASFNTFRHDMPKAASSQEAWHWLVLLASCVFLADVFIRRVSVNFAWVPPLFGRARDFVLRRQPAPAQPQYIERLKSRKAEVADHLEQLRAATRFELPAQGPLEVKPLDELAPPAPPTPLSRRTVAHAREERRDLHRAVAEGEEKGVGGAEGMSKLVRACQSAIIFLNYE